MDFRKRSPQLLFVAIISLAMAASTWAGGVITIPPSGDPTTDWTNIQTALLEATPGTVIQLEEGTYYLDRVLLAEDFRGTFRGAGKDQTFITSVGELVVSADDPPWLNPPSLDNPWAALITFMDGKFTMRDMTFRITEFVPMTIYVFGDPYQVMHSIIMVVGSETADQVRSSIRDVGFEGTAGTFGGYNVIQAIYHGGFLGDSLEARGVPLTGHRLVTGSTFSTLYEGTAIYNLAADGVLTVRNNTYEDVVVGADLQDSGGRIVFSGNEVTTHESAWGGDAYGVLVDQGIWTYFDGLAPAPPASLTVRDNVITVENGVAGISLTDWQHAYLDMDPSLFVDARHNLVLTDAMVFGVYGFGLNDVRLARNDFLGSVAEAGIWLEMTAYGKCIKNGMQELTAGTSRCLLWEDTYDNLFVGVRAFEDVMDLTDDPGTPEYDGLNKIVETGPKH